MTDTSSQTAANHGIAAANEIATAGGIAAAHGFDATNAIAAIRRLAATHGIAANHGIAEAHKIAATHGIAATHVIAETRKITAKRGIATVPRHNQSDRGNQRTATDQGIAAKHTDAATCAIAAPVQELDRHERPKGAREKLGLVKPT